MKLRIYTFLFLYILFVSCAWAHQAQWFVQGIVLDATTQNPIAEAEVRITNLQDNNLIVLKTDKQGKFRQGLDVQRNYELVIVHQDYFSWKKTELDTSDPATNHNFNFQLSPIVVGKSVLLKAVDFMPNATQLVPESEQALRELMNLLKNNPQLVVEIGVHTDSRGDAEHNLLLSQSQAEAIVAFLLSENIPPNQIQAKGYGEKYLLNHCADGIRCTSAEHAQNRRVEFSIVGVIK